MDVEKTIESMKKVWEESKQSVAVYEASSSGSAQYIIVYRYKEGLKERERGFRKPVAERFDTSNGAGSYAKWLSLVSDSVNDVWGEILFYNADLSSK